MTSKRQLAWVFDLNKCIGCQTCSVACKVLWTQDEGTEPMWWMTVNTQPGRGTPRDWETMGGGYQNGTPSLGKLPTPEEFGGGWDYNYDEVLRGGKGREVHLQKIAGSKSWGMNWDEDEGAGEFPNAYFFYLPRLCNHCTQPGCLEACPNDALFKTDDGLVLRNEDLCKGAQRCAQACPYKKIYFNRMRNVSQQCIGCFPRIEQGVAPACVRQCPGRAAWIGFLDEAGGPVSQMVNRWKVALPLHPEFGTHPNVYYVPPLSPAPLNEDGAINESAPRIPPSYLESLFGPAVHGALDTIKVELDKKRRGAESELMDILIMYRWREALGHLDRDPAEIVWS
ncbi:MAG: respiratory nitrate reductase subunit beta [Gammaproteobacteria bacterium RBG_16_66_13]|nr:MAG: respiratory nitrate reductase subunit beta [Gammaproteobacteria bacterium RBG_16_66_13]